MVAILVDALRSVIDVPGTPGPKPRKVEAQRARDQAWLMSDSTAWAFSFRRICTVLELDPQAVRAGIRTRAVRGSKLRRVYAAHRTIGAISATNGHGRAIG